MEKFGKSIAIVTGASAGIGKHLCNRLVTDAPDLTVIGLARRPTEMQNKNYFGMTCDVSKASEIEKTIDEISRKFPDKKISILVNNAGHAKPVPLLNHEKLNDPGTNQPQKLEEASEILGSMLNTNVLGLTLMTRKVILFKEVFNHTSKLRTLIFEVITFLRFQYF